MLWDLFLIKKIAKKCNLWDRKQYIYALFTVDKVNNCGLKKKKENMEKKCRHGFHCKPNGHLVYRTNLLDHLFLFIYFIWSCAAFGLQALLPPFSNFLFYFILKYAWPKHIHKFLWLTFHIRHYKVGHCPTLLQKSH